MARDENALALHPYKKFLFSFLTKANQCFERPLFHMEYSAILEIWVFDWLNLKLSGSTKKIA